MAFPHTGGFAMFDAIQATASADSITSLFALSLGFAVAGLCASGYRLYGTHFPTFRLLQMGPMPARLAAVPLLIFSAPFLIMRSNDDGSGHETPQPGDRGSEHDEVKAPPPQPAAA